MKTFDFVFYISNYWERYHRKAFVLKLARYLKERGGKILLVEPPISPVHSLFFRPHRLLNLNRNRIRQIGQNLYVYVPFAPFHFYLGGFHPVFAAANRWMLKKQLLRTLTELNFRNHRILWVFRPECVQYLGTAGEQLVVYDDYDDHLITPEGKSLPRNVQLEKILLEHSHYVFCTTSKLLQQAKQYNPNSFLIPNAADVENFQKVWQADIPIDPQIQKLPRPIIGYHGNVRSWIDFELVEHLLQNTTYTFVFAGGVQKDIASKVERLKKYRNFVHTGYIPFERLPSVIKGFDVSFIPFKLSRFNESVIPYKLFEALASGKPVVAAALPDIEQFWGKWCHTYRTPDEAIAEIQQALSPQRKLYPVEQPEKLHALSWDERMESIFRLLDESSEPEK